MDVVTRFGSDEKFAYRLDISGRLDGVTRLGRDEQFACRSNKTEQPAMSTVCVGRGAGK